MFDETTFVDRLKEGWSLTEGGSAEAPEGDKPEKEEAAESTDDEATIDEIIEAIGCLDDDNTEHWTSGGKPMVVAIETLLGKPIIASQRDEAMEQMKVS